MPGKTGSAKRIGGKLPRGKGARYNGGCSAVWRRARRLVTRSESVKKECSMAQRKFSRNEKIFYGISLLIVLSMVLGTIAVAVTPAGL